MHAEGTESLYPANRKVCNAAWFVGEGGAWSVYHDVC